jgi:aryl-alcohol dehydrogenase-like predicted oxidoreductase
MDARQLGRSGPHLSVIGLGGNNFGWRLDPAATATVVHAALDAGITHIDTAEMYGEGRSEEYIGAALGARRDDVVIATKFLPRPSDEAYTPGALARRIREAVEGSLSRLGTDRIDLYYQHYPDADGPVSEALETLADLVRAGKVLHVASSNVSAAQIDEAAAVSAGDGLIAFCGTQTEWNLLRRGVEDEIVPAAERNGLGVVPYFPLASGMLTGKYRRGEDFPAGTRFAANKERFAKQATDATFDRVAAYTAYAADHGRTITDLAIAWLLAQPTVASVIAGATTPEQVALNAVAASWTLTTEQADEVAALA